MSKKKAQPAGRRLLVEITEERWETATRSNSGGCLIADSIKDQYPELTNVAVDMVTIRATDRQKGLRYTWLTPQEAQELLLFYDQGWDKPTAATVKLWSPVHVRPIIGNKTGPKSTEERKVRRTERIAALEAKQEAGKELTADETKSLRISKAMQARAPGPERPTSRGAPELIEQPGHKPIIYGGPSPIQGTQKDNPNLLRGTDRYFGVKSADPGDAFREAVDAAVRERGGPTPAKAPIAEIGDKHLEQPPPE